MARSHDLHTHSTASDGSLAPAELVARAAAHGVDVLALTDHDTLAGLPEAREAALAAGIELVPGVEISVTWEGHTVHIVALRIHAPDPALLAGLERLRVFRDWRAEEIARRLEKKAGIAGAYEGARAYAKGSIISRTHFARFLVEKGYVDRPQAAFDHYLKNNKPGHVPGQWAGLEEAVGWIRASGGDAVVAHPARYKMTATRLRKLLGEFRECGGVAMEVVSGSHSRDDFFVMANLARQQQLLASAGSDYHGPENPWVELGRLPALPDTCVPVWRHWDVAPAQRQSGA